MRAALFALCLTSALPAQSTVNIALPVPLAQAIRAIPPDSGAAWCVLSDSLDLGAGMYYVGPTVPAARAIVPDCHGAAVLTVRPMCWIAAEEVPVLVNVVPTWTLLCGAGRRAGEMPSTSYIWRSMTVKKRGDA